MESDRPLFSAPNIPPLWLDRAIKQPFTDAGTRRDALAHAKRKLGPGPNIKLPCAVNVANAAPSSIHDYEEGRYQRPQWWSKSSSYLAFIPLQPDLSAPPLYPLLRYPDVLDSAELGPHPDPHLWGQWQQLQDAIVDATHLLLKDSGAAAVRSMPYPCARVDRNVESKASIGRKAHLYRDISIAHSLFQVWFGCLSYAIAVNEAIVDQVQTFGLASSVWAPRSWVELILVPYQENKKRERTAPLTTSRSGPGTHGPMTRSAQIPTQSDTHAESSESTHVDLTKPRKGGAVIHPNFVSSLRNTCIAKFDGSVERIGLFIEIPEKPEEMVSIDWLVDCGVPIWYAWGRREEAIVKKYPVFVRYRPPPNAIWMTTHLPQSDFNPALVVSDLPGELESTEEMDSLMLSLLEPEFLSSMKPGIAPYEKRKELREWERSWEQFFADADSKEQLLLQMETPEMKQEREARAENPPTTRPEAKFYVWERGMRSTFKRRIARDEELEELFQEKGQFGRKQARYNSLYNEWDLCRYWGPPDDEQLLHRAKVRANLRGTTVEGELLWWRVYYGLQPEPSAQDPTPAEPGPESQGYPECGQSLCHHDALDEWSSQPSSGPIDGDAHDVSSDTCSMEDGEIEEIETDVSWKRRATDTGTRP
ncbi:hypothetical protein NMY22_g7094 [Coprinellus aureogranulatus]|nr:hypothetical protein NMY22_g7094 [Coprinellus aureogranulatus]